jgi:chromosome segregation ATPase
MPIHDEIIKRLLDTPAAKDAAVAIEAERSTRRRDIAAKVAKLRDKRDAITEAAEEVFRKARSRHREVEIQLAAARKALDAAHKDVSNARGTHGREIRELETELAGLANDVTGPQ